MSKENINLILPIYYVDAFISKEHSPSGNPAAVVILQEWLPDDILLAIAAEVNLSETAFLVGRHLRWFTPKVEVNLCGHATLATAFVLVNYFCVNDPSIEFETHSGKLIVSQLNDYYTLNFPITPYRYDETAPKKEIEEALDTAVSELFVTHDRYICVVDSYDKVAMNKTAGPDLNKVAALPLPGLIVTAKITEADNLDGVDFVSRYFAPAKGVPEDPVTGTSHCVLAPFWGQRLGKTRLNAKQISSRGGDIICEWRGDRVYLTGQARAIASHQITINNKHIFIKT